MLHWYLENVSYYIHISPVQVYDWSSHVPYDTSFPPSTGSIMKERKKYWKVCVIADQLCDSRFPSGESRTSKVGLLLHLTNLSTTHGTISCALFYISVKKKGKKEMWNRSLFFFSESKKIFFFYFFVQMHVILTM